MRVARPLDAGVADDDRRAPVLGLAGALSGGLAGMLIYIVPLDGRESLGRCLFSGPDRCEGLPAGCLLYPGALFGLFVGVMLWRNRTLQAGAAALFALGSLAINAVATQLWLEFADPLLARYGNAATFLVIVALCGAVAGAVGAGLLALLAGRLLGGGFRRRLPTTGAVLGALTPLALVPAIGLALFYAVWQGGCAILLAGSPGPAASCRPL